MAPSALAIRRITLDTKNAMTLAESGLFWIPDENDITHGWAVVCGCEDTPYHGGAFCFEVRFPDNYPFEPPAFTYLTNDGRTRFNPNLYKNGKVCLSLLNTWQGEPWSGVQSLSSVLQCIQTAVINQDPLRNEPAYSSMSLHADIPIYNRMIFHAVLETAILGQLQSPPDYLVPVYDSVQAWAKKARDALVTKARDLAATWDGKTEQIQFYSMTQRYRFADLATQLASL
jgi:ubiquitin-conjugating enzyme E2 Z